MKKVILTYGLLAGLIVSILMLTSLSLKHDKYNLQLAEIVGYASMIVALSLIFVALNTYRKNYSGGYLSFGKAFQIGLYITLIAATMYVIGWLIYSSTIGSGYMDDYFNISIAEIKNSGKPAPEIANELQEIEKFREMYKNPFMKIGFTYMEILPVGLLISLVAALIMKRKPKNHQVAATV